MDWKKTRKFLGISAAVVGTAFIVTSIVAKKKQGESRYEDDPDQKNSMEGKKVIFVEDEDDIENADGMKGHLEALGESEHKAGVYEKYVKRGIDVVLSFGGLVVLSPVLLGIAVAIKIDDPGPVLFTQKRVGENKKYFKLHKFRSMKMSTPHDKPTHMLENPEQYITRVGKFIRAHSLDELPQIWDIFIGNMSVIGPRPGLWNKDFLTAERDKYGANDIKPGLTGWAQINGRDELEISKKAKLDGEYVQNMGVAMDAKVFFKSLHVFGNDDSVVEGGTGEIKKNDMDLQDSSIKVSIIMPAYNAESYIKDAIESVLLQTYPNWELLVIDDCSTDKTVEIVNQCATEDARIRLIHNKVNLGVALTRNVAIKNASGKYIAFLDSDDLWDTKKLATQLAFMERNGYNLSFTSYQKFSTTTGQVGKIVRAPKMVGAEQLLGNTIIGCLTVMYNCDELGKVYMPNLQHMEDNATWYSIMKRGYVAYGLDENLAKYREGNTSLTSNKRKAALKQWKVYREYFLFSRLKSAQYFMKYAINALKKYI